MTALKEIAIVVIAYNRLLSVARLLESLSKANYEGDLKPTLIISIDKSDSTEVEKYAHSFKWEHGQKKVICHKENLGLKKHVFECGDLSNEYDAIILLEDDLYVSPDFYKYAIQSLEFFKNDSDIAGISLYNIDINQTSMLNFTPEVQNFDNYFIQYAQSWGQAWTKYQWNDFRNWYNLNKKRLFNEKYIPKNIREWGEKSWLKYHILYCIENNKFFVYPYISLTTNFSETGEHNVKRNSSFQVPLDFRRVDKYSFVNLRDSNSVKYDCFFERIVTNTLIKNINSEDICIDLYGNKEFYENKKYLISSNKLPYRIVGTFNLSFRPHETNIFFENNGNDLALYNLQIKDNSKNSIKQNLNYYYKIVGKKNVIYLFKELFIKYILNS